MKYNKVRNNIKKEERKREIAALNCFSTEEKAVEWWANRLENTYGINRGSFLFQLRIENPLLHDLVQRELQRRENIRLAPKDEKLVIMDDGPMEERDESSLV